VISSRGKSGDDFNCDFTEGEREMIRIAICKGGEERRRWRRGDVGYFKTALV
jgi:hypothetical protein